MNKILNNKNQFHYRNAELQGDESTNNIEDKNLQELNEPTEFIEEIKTIEKEMEVDEKRKEIRKESTRKTQQVSTKEWKFRFIIGAISTGIVLMLIYLCLKKQLSTDNVEYERFKA